MAAIRPRSLIRWPNTLASGTAATRSFTSSAGALRIIRSLQRNTTPIHLCRVHPQQRRYLQDQSVTPGGDGRPLGPSNELQPQPDAQKSGSEGSKEDGNTEKTTWWKMFESAATTAASITVLGIAGVAYHKYYKHLVLGKIDNAFKEGDPAISLANAGASNPRDQRVVLEEQNLIDRIVRGEKKGNYYLLVGEKGTGKTSMLLTAMHKTTGDACSMMEAHADPEIFRIRLGKALDFEFHEDYIGSLFSIRGPRDTTAILDIERALNKLEKVALRRQETITPWNPFAVIMEAFFPQETAAKKPLVMIINSMHLIRDDENGRDLLELLQQRAEGWAENGLITMIFNSDDYWVYERMKQYGSRMEVINVKDLSKGKSIAALKKYRWKYYRETPTQETLERIYERVGGRLQFLNRVAKAGNMLAKCEEICEVEKSWFLNQCGLLGSEMDDDVMGQQKFASSAMVLARKLVELEKDQEHDQAEGHKLPELSLYEARRVMTRADFVQEYDRINIFTIDYKAKVRADSVPMQNAFREICAEEGFDQLLEDTLQRISDIESLGRTRELTIKDLWYGGKYNMIVKNHKGAVDKTATFDVTEGKREGED